MHFYSPATLEYWIKTKHLHAET